MKRSSVKIVSAHSVHVAEFDDGRRLVATRGGCYEPDISTCMKIRHALSPKTTRVIKDSVTLPIVMGLVVTGALTCHLLEPSRPVGGSLGIALTATVLMFNVLIHEAGHALVLKRYLPDAHISFGFRLVFVFPTFYVNTTASYLLPKGKRIAVHLAGVFANAMWLALSDLLFPSFSGINDMVAWMMTLNLVPIMRGDGHHVLAALLGWKAPAPDSKRRYLEECVRGAAMVVLVILLTFITRLAPSAN